MQTLLLQPLTDVDYTQELVPDQICISVRSIKSVCDASWFHFYQIFLMRERYLIHRMSEQEVLREQHVS